MSYGGDSNAKKLARVWFWLDLVDRFVSDGSISSRHALVLSGPDAGDVKTLSVLGMPLSNITAVDRDRIALASAMSSCPGANYVHGEIEEVASRRENRRRFSLIHLDYCSPISKVGVRSAVRIASMSLKDRGSMGVAFMYGREISEAREDLLLWKSVIAEAEKKMMKLSDKELLGSRTSDEESDAELIKMIRDPKSEHRRKAVAGLSREIFLRSLFPKESLRLGFGLLLRRCLFYRSVKRGDLRAGVPMLYASLESYRPSSTTSKRMLKGKVIEQANRTYRSGSRTDRYLGESPHLDSDPNGEVVRDFAIYLGRRMGAAKVAILLNEPRQRVAAWMAWDTMRARDQVGGEV